MDFKANVIATATNVLDGLRNGAPITDSAREAMPRLVDLLRSLGEHTLAEGIANAMTSAKPEFAIGQTVKHTDGQGVAVIGKVKSIATLMAWDDPTKIASHWYNIEGVTGTVADGIEAVDA